MKRAKKPKQKRVTVNREELKAICNEQVRKAFLIMMTAAADELDLDSDQLVATAKRAERYAEYIDQHVMRLDEVSRILEKNAGIIWRW